MEPSLPSSNAGSVPDERRASERPQRGPVFLSTPFLQALFLCMLALAAIVVQISGGSKLDAVLATGIGLFLGWLLYPKRLFILTALVLPLGVVNQLFDTRIISGQYIEAAHLLALALGLLTIIWVMHSIPAWVHPGALSPGFVVAVLGLLLLVADASGSAEKVIFSFWLPAIVLGALGVSYLVISAFGRTKS